jgi:hypothetical protein
MGTSNVNRSCAGIRQLAHPPGNTLAPNHRLASFERRRKMPKMHTGMIACAMLLAALHTPVMAGPGDEARQHVQMAQTTLSDFLRDPNMTWLQSHIADAKGVLIVPKVVKVGFVFGGSGGAAFYWCAVKQASGTDPRSIP